MWLYLLGKCQKLWAYPVPRQAMLGPRPPSSALPCPGRLAPGTTEPGALGLLTCSEGLSVRATSPGEQERGVSVHLLALSLLAFSKATAWKVFLTALPLSPRPQKWYSGVRTPGPLSVFLVAERALHRQQCRMSLTLVRPASS